jgi:tetratricopeptide (TPR) repeat protein
MTVLQRVAAFVFAGLSVAVAAALAADPLPAPKAKKTKPVERLDLALPEFSADDPLGLPLLDLGSISEGSEPAREPLASPVTPASPEILREPVPIRLVFSESALSVPIHGSDELLRKVTPLPPEAPTPPPSGTFDLTKMAVDHGSAILVVKGWDKFGTELGSSMGFFVSADGRFLTDGNLLSPTRAKELDYFTAIGADGTSYIVKGVLATDAGRNLLLLQADAQDVPFLQLADLDAITVPAPVVIAGRIGERDVSMSEVSLMGERNIGGREKWWSLQGRTDSAFPGSPVLSGEGKVLGVVTMYVPGNKWVNYAVPGPVAKAMLTKVKPGQKPVPPRRVLRKTDAAAGDESFVDAYDAFTAGSFERAVQILQRIVVRTPQSGDAWGFLGLALARCGKSEEALGCFEKAVNLQPDNPALWAQLALLYRARGNVGAELDALSRLLANNPGDSLGWLFLGEVRLRRGEFGAAAEALDRAASLMPDSPHASFLLAFTTGKLGNLAAAEGAVLKSLQLDRESPRGICWVSFTGKEVGPKKPPRRLRIQSIGNQPTPRRGLISPML